MSRFILGWLVGVLALELAATAESLEPPRDPRGPGAAFTTIEAAAVDALAYAYLQARDECEPEIMRGGTIYQVDSGAFSYGDIQRAASTAPHRIRYALQSGAVARFHLYPLDASDSVNRVNERASRSDLRSVAVIDPLHRPLYILHPSLTIRVYRNLDGDPTEIATLDSQPRIARRCTRPYTSTVSLNSTSPAAGH